MMKILCTDGLNDAFDVGMLICIGVGSVVIVAWPMPT